MEKEKEFFDKLRNDQIDQFIKEIDRLRTYNEMSHLLDSRSFYIDKLNEIFNEHERTKNYFDIKEMFEIHDTIIEDILNSK